MAQKLRIEHFLQPHQNYTLWIIQGKIQLELPHLLETQTRSLSGRAWLNFEDQAYMDDVNLHIIVFKLDAMPKYFDWLYTTLHTGLLLLSCGIAR